MVRMTDNRTGPQSWKGHIIVRGDTKISLRLWKTSRDTTMEGSLRSTESYWGEKLKSTGAMEGVGLRSMEGRLVEYSLV